MTNINKLYFLILLGLICSGLFAQNDLIIKEGMKAPNFILQDHTGESFTVIIQR